MQTALLGIYILLSPLFGSVAATRAYRKGVRDGDSTTPWLVRPHNPRSATLYGIFVGVCWPIIAAVCGMFCIIIMLTDWVKNGAKND